MMLAASLPMAAQAASGEWQLNGNGLWTFRYSDGTYATDEWQPSGDHMFYLGSDGIMLTNSLIEDGDNYYCVDANGARVTNQWRKAEDSEGEMRWYYFGQNGKALKAPSSGAVKTVIINGKKYAFDSEGRMLYGWVNSDSAELTGEDDDSAWKDATYYFGDPEDGAASVGWRQITVIDDDDEQSYWFWFGTNGKKALSYKKTIDGVQYAFDTEDGHMLTGWAAATSSNAIAPDSDVKYLKNDGSAAKNRWVWAVPAEDYIPEDYNDEEYSWFFTNKSGIVYTDEIRKINGKKYALDEYGRMLTGFAATADGKTGVTSLGAADEMTESRLFSEQFPYIHYCSDDEADGSIKTGYVYVGIDDGTRQFWFDKNGIGTTGYISSIKKFTVSGMVLCANDDDGGVAGVLVRTDTDDLVLDGRINGLIYGTDIYTDGSCVLVNKSGAIQKNKKNMKSDDLYFCTDSQGRVTYVGYEKAD